MRNRPHYYLWGLAVDPNHQVKGIGAALMLPVLTQADAQKVPIYLETHDEKNVSYYQKHGFDLIDTVAGKRILKKVLTEPHGKFSHLFQKGDAK